MFLFFYSTAKFLVRSPELSLTQNVSGFTELILESISVKPPAMFCEGIKTLICTWSNSSEMHGSYGVLYVAMVSLIFFNENMALAEQIF